MTLEQVKLLRRMNLLYELGVLPEPDYRQMKTQLHAMSRSVAVPPTLDPPQADYPDLLLATIAELTLVTLAALYYLLNG